MNRTMSLIAGVMAAALLCTTGATAQEFYEERWIRLADTHAQAIAVEPGASYEAIWREAHESVWPSVEQKCRRVARRTGMASFQSIAILDARGDVTAFLTMPRSEHLQCFERNMVGRRYPAPPSAPYYQVVRSTISAD